MEVNAKENRVFNLTTSTVAVESLKDEMEYRRLIKCFLGENTKDGGNYNDDVSESIMKARENAGEKLIYLAATEATALQLVQCQVLDVCKMLISIPTTPARLVIIALCIRCNLLLIKSCYISVFSSDHVLVILDTVLTNHVANPAILSQYLKEIIIIFNQDYIDVQNMIDKNTYAALGSALNMIQTNSLDSELLSRSWQLAYYITVNSNSHFSGGNLMPNWDLPNLSGEATTASMLELLQSTMIDNSSGLTWLLMFMDALFSGSTSFAEYLIEHFSDENLNGILLTLLQLTHSDCSNISRDESFSLLSCLESLLSHISDEDIENRINEMQSFDKLGLFILSTGFEIALARDNDLFISFLMVIKTNFELIKKLKLHMIPSLKSSLNDLIEVLDLT